MTRTRGQFVGGERITLTEVGATVMGLPFATVLIVVSVTDEGLMRLQWLNPRPSVNGWIHAVDPSTGRIWAVDLDADVAEVLEPRRVPPAVSLTFEQALPLCTWLERMDATARGLAADIDPAIRAMRTQLGSFAVGAFVPSAHSSSERRR